MSTLYTIGYSGFTIENFIDALKKYGITCIIDVRSNPISKYYPDYNKIPLENTQKKVGIYYRNYVVEFGARQTYKGYYSIEGYLDFSKFAKSEPFRRGVKKIEDSLQKGYTFALMCAEKDPIDCHRNIMIASEFFRMGYEVKNILSDGNYEPQELLERRLLDMYYPNRDQISLFSDDSDKVDKKTLLMKAYAKRNAEIGYRVEEE